MHLWSTWYETKNAIEPIWGLKANSFRIFTILFDKANHVSQSEINSYYNLFWKGEIQSILQNLVDYAIVFRGDPHKQTRCRYKRIINSKIVTIICWSVVTKKIVEKVNQNNDGCWTFINKFFFLIRFFKIDMIDKISTKCQLSFHLRNVTDISECYTY